MSDVAPRHTLEFEADFVRIRIRGILTVADAERLQTAAAAHSTNRLWDSREGDLTAWSAADMRRFIVTLSARAKPGERSRVAALVARDVEFGIARMFSMHADGSIPTDLRVFRDEAAAVDWVRGTAADAAGAAD